MKLKLKIFFVKTSIFLLMSILIASYFSVLYPIEIKAIDNDNIQILYKEEMEPISVFSHDNRKIYLTEKDIYLMAQVVYAESIGEPYEGKVAVASVILNRLKDGRFPMTVEGVVKQKSAFSCVVNGAITVTPNDDCINAVFDALSGSDPTSKALFYYNPEIATCNWMKSVKKDNIKTIGNHVFFVTP